jgi:hypothetical protein
VCTEAPASAHPDDLRIRALILEQYGWDDAVSLEMPAAGSDDVSSLEASHPLLMACGFANNWQDDYWALDDCYLEPRDSVTSAKLCGLICEHFRFAAPGSFECVAFEVANDGERCYLIAQLQTCTVDSDCGDSGGGGDDECWDGHCVSAVGTDPPEDVVVGAVGILCPEGGCPLPEQTDCAGEWSDCTSACEDAASRTWTETAAQLGAGAACEAASDCMPGDGGCPLPEPIAYQYIAEGSCRDDRGGHGFYAVYSGQSQEDCEALCNADPTCHSISYGNPSGSCHPHCRESTELCTSGANMQPVITPTTASPEGDLQCWLSPLGQLRTTECTDTDNGLMGRFSYTCASIDDNLDKCTGYDANGFVAGEMCCQCGGGAIPDQAAGGRRRRRRQLEGRPADVKRQH